MGHKINPSGDQGMHSIRSCNQPGTLAAVAMRQTSAFRNAVAARAHPDGRSMGGGQRRRTACAFAICKVAESNCAISSAFWEWGSPVSREEARAIRFQTLRAEGPQAPPEASMTMGMNLIPSSRQCASVFRNEHFLVS